MPEINYIKHLRENEDLSISDIAKKLGINWRTAKKYADGEVSIPEITGNKQGMMYTEKYGQIVDIWLEEDLLEKKKNRRNNKNIFKELQEEHGFPGSYRTVCDYIQHRKPEIHRQKRQRFERLEHPPGEAQVDFGTVQVVKEGAYQDVKALILSFPCSNAGFAYPMPSENSECFLEGLGRLFRQAGGVPQRLRIDNLTAAVVSVGKGEKRIYTDAFLAFQAYYSFEIQACNPASGHEKGNVENKVGYTRNLLFVTAPVIEDYDQLAGWMANEMETDRRRVHYEKGVKIEELWQDERAALKALPLEDLPIYRIDAAKTNKYGEVTIDGKKVLIPGTRPGQPLSVKKDWGTFTCFTKEGEIVYQAPRPYMSKATPIPWMDIFEHWRFKPRAVPYSRYFKYLPKDVQVYLTHDVCRTKERVKGIRELLKQDYGLKEIASLFTMPGRLDRTPHELLGFLEAKKLSLPEKLEEVHTPDILVNYEMNLDDYDQKLCGTLSSGGVK